MQTLVSRQALYIDLHLQAAAKEGSAPCLSPTVKVAAVQSLFQADKAEAVRAERDARNKREKDAAATFKVVLSTSHVIALACIMNVSQYLHQGHSVVLDRADTHVLLAATRFYANAYSSGAANACC